MFTLPRFIAVGVFALFLVACAYIGLINEQLKAVLDPWNRAVVTIGFIIGAGTVCRYLTDIAVKRLQKADRSPKSCR